MAARYLRRHGDHRARAGRGPGKIQPLWRRVSLTARTSGGGLGSVAPAARPWRRGPRASTRIPNATAASRVSLSSTSRTERTAVSSSQPMQPRVTQHRLSQGPRKLALSFAHRSVHLVVLGPHCPQIRAGSKGLSCRRKPQLPAAQQLQKYSLWSAACKCYAYHSGVASNPFVPHPQTASSKARYL